MNTTLEMKGNLTVYCHREMGQGDKARQVPGATAESAVFGTQRTT